LHVGARHHACSTTQQQQQRQHAPAHPSLPGQPCEFACTSCLRRSMHQSDTSTVEIYAAHTCQAQCVRCAAFAALLLCFICDSDWAPLTDTSHPQCNTQ
jgi:hypothetical protein